jgi:plasmid stabilization system protein ParE
MASRRRRVVWGAGAHEALKEALEFIGAGLTVREIFVYSYRLIYRIDPDTVTIVAFLHGARDFERWNRD